MDVATKESLSGYIAQKDELKQDEDKVPMLVMQFGQKRFRREPDDTFTLTGTGYRQLVMFGAAAVAADRLYTVGDDVIAVGRTKPRTYTRDGQRVEVIEFRANKLVFDTSHPRYHVTRTPRTSPAQAHGREGAARSAAIETPEGELSPEPVGMGL